MSGRRRLAARFGRASRAVLIGVLLVLAMAPLLALLGTLANAIRDGAAPDPGLLLTTRTQTLLASSLGLAGGVAAAGTGLALLLGSYAWSSRRHVFFAALLVMLLVPPYVHTMAWSSAAQGLNRLLGVSLLPVTGWLMSGWVQLMSFLPFATALTSLGYLLVPVSALEQARLTAPDSVVFRRIALPLMRPATAVAASALFVMSALDYSVPSLFQVSVYALELFADFSATSDPARVLVLSLPLILCTLLLSLAALGAGRRLLGRSERVSTAAARLDHLSDGFLMLRQAALVVFALQMAVPLVALLLTAGSPAQVFASVRAAQQELLTTVTVAGAGALLATLGAYPLARRLCAPGGAARLLAPLLVLPLALPAPLIGVGLIVAANRDLPLPLYGTLAMPVLASFCRFLPWAVLALAAQMSRSDPRLAEQAELAPVSAPRRFLRVTLPLLAPGFVAAFGLVFALTAGELGATLLVAPPGEATLTMRIYNYLHYGATSAVAGLALVVVLLTVLAELAVLAAARRSVSPC